MQIKELSKSKDQSQAELGPRIYQLNKWGHVYKLLARVRRTDFAQELLSNASRQAT